MTAMTSDRERTRAACSRFEQHRIDDMADMSIGVQYEALSKLLQPTSEGKYSPLGWKPQTVPTDAASRQQWLLATAGCDGSTRQQSQPRSSSSAARPLVDPIHCTAEIAQPSGRGYPSNVLNGIWTDAEVDDQVSAGPSQDPRETPR